MTSVPWPSHLRLHSAEGQEQFLKVVQGQADEPRMGKSWKMSQYSIHIQESEFIAFHQDFESRKFKERRKLLKKEFAKTLALFSDPTDPKLKSPNAVQAHSKRAHWSELRYEYHYIRQYPIPSAPRPSYLRLNFDEYSSEQIRKIVRKRADEAPRGVIKWRRLHLKIKALSKLKEKASDTSDPAADPTALKLEPEQIVQADVKEGDSIGQYDSRSDDEAPGVPKKIVYLQNLDMPNFYVSDSDVSDLYVSELEGWSGDSGGGSSTDCQADLTADSHCQESNRKRPRDPIDEGDAFISRLASGIREHVKEALDSALLPLVLALRTREENEQEHREKLLALEIEKLELKRQKRKLQLKRQPGGRSTGQSKGRHQITK